MKYDLFISKAKIGENGVILNSPKNIEAEFLKIGYKNTFGAGKSKTTLFFVLNSDAFNKTISGVIANIEYDSACWICYPKGTSKIKTDINRDILWELMIPFGLRAVTMVAFDEVWSAMRFRPIEKVRAAKK